MVQMDVQGGPPLKRPAFGEGDRPAPWQHQLHSPPPQHPQAMHHPPSQHQPGMHAPAQLGMYTPQQSQHAPHQPQQGMPTHAGQPQIQIQIHAGSQPPPAGSGQLSGLAPTAQASNNSSSASRMVITLIDPLSAFGVSNLEDDSCMHQVWRVVLAMKRWQCNLLLQICLSACNVVPAR